MGWHLSLGHIQQRAVLCWRLEEAEHAGQQCWRPAVQGEGLWCWAAVLDLEGWKAQKVQWLSPAAAMQRLGGAAAAASSSGRSTAAVP
eukprot:6376392-Lingulodinium_polyedra.AAC.1